MECLALILGVVGVIIAITFFCINEKRSSNSNGFGIAGGLLLLASLVCLMSCLMIYACSPTPTQLKRQYNQVNYLIETYDIEKDENLSQMYHILNLGGKINSEILAARKYDNNVFVGFMYKTEIAELELLKADKLTEKLKK